MKFQPGTKTTTKIIVVDEELNVRDEQQKGCSHDGWAEKVGAARFNAANKRIGKVGEVPL